VSSFGRPHFEFWLNQHPNEGRQLAELVIRQAQARARADRKSRRRRIRGGCASGQAHRLRIDRNWPQRAVPRGGGFGGRFGKNGSRQGFQAILPLRGKVLNTWEVERDRLFGNAEVHDIAVAIGVDPHGPSDNVNLEGLRYGKICILADADVDGSHIQVLLLTLFFRHFPQLVDRGTSSSRGRRCFGSTSMRRASARASHLLPRRRRARRHAGEAGR